MRYAAALWGNVRFTGEAPVDGNAYVRKDKTWVKEGLDFDVYLDFIDVEAFTYNCPANVKFTSMVYEGTAPTLSVALNTNMDQFDKLVVTPTSVGLVILKGVLL